MKKNMKLLIIGGVGLIILVIVMLIFGFSSNKETGEYEYVSNGYAIGSILIIENENYQEVSKDIFEEICEVLANQLIEPYEENLLGRVNYNNGVDDWKYNIYGSENAEERILLKGEEAYIFNDANYPEVYFCRKDIFNELMGELESLEGINLDIFLEWQES